MYFPNAKKWANDDDASKKINPSVSTWVEKTAYLSVDEAADEAGLFPSIKTSALKQFEAFEESVA